MGGTEYWTVKKRNWETVSSLVKSLDISPLAAQLLVNRGIETPETAATFFETPLESLISLISIPGCQEAASLIRESIAREEKIVIFGDYDADGVTATALMVKGLRAEGASVDYYVPDRFSEGYDLNEDFVRWASDKGYRLLITVDCGIKAFDCVNLAKETGMKIVVSDHHEPFDIIPEANAVVNPKMNEDIFVKDLAGVGVALALICTLWSGEGTEFRRENFQELLELAAIGTVADSVPLVGCNRTIVKHGLKGLGDTANIGLAALFEVEGFKNKKDFDVADISFKIAPCINAVGRIGDAGDAVELLISDSLQQAWEMAKKLHRENAVRQNLDGAVFLEVLEIIDKEIDLEREKVIVLASDNWHPGVIGITAARLVQRLNMPVILISLENGIGKGSGRSLGSFNLNEAFEFCSEFLIKYGGHRLAGGFLIGAEDIPTFRKKINDYALTCSDNRLCLGEVDSEVFLEDIDFRLIEEMDAFKPFGPGNPVPLFVCRNVHIENARLVGKKNEHLKITVSAGESEVECIGFKMGEKASFLKKGDYVDIVFSPQMNTWNGTTKLQYLLSDITLCRRVSAKRIEKITNICNAAMLLKEEELDLQKHVKGLKNGGRMGYLNIDADGKVLTVLPYLREAGMAVIFLFPLQSMAADFERSVLEVYPHLRLLRIDCITSNEIIERAAGLFANGSLDLLVTSLGTWLKNKNLVTAFEGRNACMCINIGHWGKMYPGENYIYEVALVLSQWEKSVLFLGSGEHFLDEKLCSKLGIKEVLGEIRKSDNQLFFPTSNDKLALLGDICSRFEKNLVFVNTGREAVAVSREIRKIYNDRPYVVRSYYGDMVSSQKDLLVEDFNYGFAGVLVASRSFEPYRIKHTCSLVVHSFPLNIFDFNRFLIAPWVYLIYNNADLGKSSAYVRSLCPDEDLIQYVANNVKCSGNVSANELLKRLSRGLQGNRYVNRRALAITLSIFFDMYLVNSGCGDIEIDTVKSSWRYTEALKEVEFFELLVENLDVGFLEAAAELESVDGGETD
ncbi:MAG: single-stranded-DNA-specific exonuclease RecJ [Bacillota bacterium]|jgi:single-stranded-DNA-specific exonuclease RecJ